MVRPVRVDETHLGDCGITLLLVLKVALAELHVVKVHRKRIFLKKRFKLVLAVRDKAINCLNSSGDVESLCKCFGLVERCLAALHEVDNICLYLGDLLFSHVARKDIHSCGTDSRSVLICNELYTLCAGIGTLVELPRQIFNREYTVTCIGCQLVKNNIALRLGENCILCFCEYLLGDTLDVIAIEYAKGCERGYHQIFADVRKKRSRFNCMCRLFFNKYSVNHVPTPLFYLLLL